MTTTRSYTWINPGGRRDRVDGVAALIFQPGHVTFYDDQQRLLLAEPNARVIALTQVVEDPT